MDGRSASPVSGLAGAGLGAARRSARRQRMRLSVSHALPAFCETANDTSLKFARAAVYITLRSRL